MHEKSLRGYAFEMHDYNLAISGLSNFEITGF